MKKFRKFMLGTSFMWMPILGCYIAEMLANLLTKIL